MGSWATTSRSLGVVNGLLQIEIYDISCLDRLVLMPSFFILLRKVLG